MMQGPPNTSVSREELVLVGHEGTHTSFGGAGNAMGGIMLSAKPGRQMYLQSSFGVDSSDQSSRMSAYLHLALRGYFMTPAEAEGRPFSKDITSRVVNRLQNCAGFAERRNPMLSGSKPATVNTLEFLAATLATISRADNRRTPLPWLVSLAQSAGKTIFEKNIRSALNVINATSQQVLVDSGRMTASATTTPQPELGLENIDDSGGGGLGNMYDILSATEAAAVTRVHTVLKQTCPLWVASSPCSGRGGRDLVTRVGQQLHRLNRSSRGIDDLLGVASSSPVSSATRSELAAVRLVVAFRQVVQKQMSGCTYSQAAEAAVTSCSLELLHLASDLYEVQVTRVFNALCALNNVPGLLEEAGTLRFHHNQKTMTSRGSRNGGPGGLKEEAAAVEGRGDSADDQGTKPSHDDSMRNIKTRGKRNRSPNTKISGRTYHSTTSSSANCNSLVPLVPQLSARLLPSDPVLCRPLAVNSLVAVQTARVVKAGVPSTTGERGRAPSPIPWPPRWLTKLELCPGPSNSRSSADILSVPMVEHLFDLKSVVKAARHHFLQQLREARDVERTGAHVQEAGPQVRASKFKLAVNFFETYHTTHHLQQQTRIVGSDEVGFIGGYTQMPPDSEVVNHVETLCPTVSRCRGGGIKWGAHSEVLDLDEVSGTVPGATAADGERGGLPEHMDNQCSLILSIGTFEDDEDDEVLKIYIRSDASKQ